MLVIGYKSLRAGLRTGFRNVTVSYDLRVHRVSEADWHHVAATFQAGSTALTLYFDGMPVVREMLGARSNGNQRPLSIGREGTTGKYWTGKLDDVRIWNRARTASEIGATYQAQLAGPQPGLVGNWQFDAVRASGVLAPDNASTHQAMLVHGADFTCQTHAALLCAP